MDSPAGARVGELSCTLVTEVFLPSGMPGKKTVYRSAKLILGRNQFQDVVLNLQVGGREHKYAVKDDIVIHKKFVKDGKATLKLPSDRMQLMLSNCPPDQLIMFLKTMTTKSQIQTLRGKVLSQRQRLLSDAPRSFQDISPLQLKELQDLHEIRAKQAEKAGVKPGAQFFTPKGKRKRDAVTDTSSKENMVPKKAKLVRTPKGTIKKGVRFSQPVLNPVQLSAEQNKILKAVLAGDSIFFTGSAGTGKSFLLRRIIGALAPEFTFATASTGVAACHIGGTTLHAFAGIGSGKAPIETCVQLASRATIAQQWRKCRHLIIDEISMVDGEFFDKLEMVARVVRKNDSPFGGIQLILCGDFLQLPPVTKGKEKRQFAFQSKSWRRCIGENFELTAVRRQDDPRFINILQHVRLGRCPLEVSEMLSATSRHKIEKDGILATRLCTHKEDVDHINEHYLNKLSNKSHKFQATDSDNYYTKTINAMCPVKQSLDLREGAQVMLTKNLDVQAGLVNGARGIVTGFETDGQGLPIVKFKCGASATIYPERWTFKMGNSLYLTRKQLPLKLAWAISIHKSQGMTLDCVEISLSRVFESGQAYVALSRAKSLEGLRVLDFDSKCVRADPSVIQFYKSMELSKVWRQMSLDTMYDTQFTQMS